MSCSLNRLRARRLRQHQLRPISGQAKRQIRTTPPPPHPPSFNRLLSCSEDTVTQSNRRIQVFILALIVCCNSNNSNQEHISISSFTLSGRHLFTQTLNSSSSNNNNTGTLGIRGSRSSRNQRSRDSITFSGLHGWLKRLTVQRPLVNFPTVLQIPVRSLIRHQTTRGRRQSQPDTSPEGVP